MFQLVLAVFTQKMTLVNAYQQVSTGGKERKVSEAQTGKKCPNCGAEGKWHGEHETAVRNYQIYPAGRDFEPPRTIVDVGWRCWNCGWEWGFEVVEGDGV